VLIVRDFGNTTYIDV